MAASGADVLKEFVVSIGFQVDDAQFRSFSSKFEKIAEGIGEVGVAIGAVSALIDKGVGVMANRFEEMYYAAQQSQTSVRSLMDLDYAAQQVGFSAGESTAMIENMQSIMRKNPGLKIYESWMGDTTDPTEKMLNFADKLAAMGKPGSIGYAQSVSIAGQFGISESQLFRLQKGSKEIRAMREEHDKLLRASGLDPDKFAEQSKNYENNARKLQASIQILEALLAQKFMPWAQRTIDFAIKVIQAFDKANKATGGASTAALGGAMILLSGSLLKLLPAFTKVLLSPFGLGNLVKSGGTAATESVLTGAAGGGLAAVLAPIVVGVLVALGIAWILKTTGAADKLQKFGEEHSVAKVWGNLTGHPIAERGDGGVYGNNPGNLRKWEKGQAEYTLKGSGSFVAFKSAMDGLSAMAGQLLRYERGGQDTLEKIIAKYAPPKENDTGAYISDVEKETGIARGKHLDLSDPSVLSSVVRAMIHHEQGKNPYDASVISAAVNQRLAKEGGSGTVVHVDQKVNVTGAADPQRTATLVGDEVASANRDMLRNSLPRVN